MKFLLNFVLNLGKNIRSFLVFNFIKFRKQSTIEKFKKYDKQIVAKLNKKKIPNWKQFKRLSTTLSNKESWLIRIFSVVIMICAIFLFYNLYYKNLTPIPKIGGEFTEGLIGSPLYINPLFAQGHGDVDSDLTKLIFSGLLRYNENLEITTDLADRYEISEDRKTYTFYLKENLKWHDGYDLTASDIVYTIQNIKNPEFKSTYNRTFQGVEVEKIDDLTVKFTLEEPYVAFLNILTVGIIPQHIWYDFPAINAKLAIYNQKPIGSGPYKFKSLIKEKSGLIKAYTLEKNKDYHNREPYIDKIIFKFYPDYETAINALSNKEIQNISFISKENLKNITNKREFNFNEINLSQITAIFFNSKNNELLKNDNIRAALSHAIDKNKIVEDVLNNQGRVTDSPLPSGFRYYNSDVIKYEYDQKKSLELLVEEKWKIDGEYFKKDDQELKITLTTIDQTEYINTANLIKEYWNSIGVNVDLQIISKEQIDNEIITPRNYQALLYGEIIGYDPDLFSFWHSSQKEYPGANLTNYVNRKTDNLLEQARIAVDDKEREQKYYEFQKILTEDIPAIFLYTPTYTYPTNKKLKGLNITRITIPSDRFTGIENWYIKTKKRFIK